MFDDHAHPESTRNLGEILSPCPCESGTETRAVIIPVGTVFATGERLFIDKTGSRFYSAFVLNCPHCGKPIPDALIVRRAGQIGGRRTAKRGPVYFRKIAAMRKKFKGGRPRKKKGL